MATLQSIAFCCSFPRHPMLLSTRISATSSSSSSFHTCCFLTAARVWNSRGDRNGKRAQELWGYGGCRGRGGAFVRTALFPSIGKFMNWKRRDGDVLSDENDDREPEKEESGSGSLSGMLPYVVAATAVAALANPSTFSWVSKDYYAPALGGIMLSVGIRLSLDDFALAFNRPLLLSIGFTAQYLLKPLLGMLVARIFRIPPMFYAGFVLTCCVSGAQLSSYASFLSRGDVALSILLTSTTTISSVIVTPLLTGFLIGSVVPVDAFAMSKSILQVVLLPITIGIILNTHAKAAVNVIQPIMPFVAMICTSLCIGSPLAINRAQLLSRGGFNLLLPILVFHLLAFTLGYWITKIPILRQEEDVCKAISLCTGMQSSTLAGLLATQFLGSSQAVPAACSVVVMAIIGLYLASFWGSGFRIRDIPLSVTNKTRSDANS